jgi:hypothetical protein
VKTVFILGAGASQAAGAPLMFDFMERASRLQRRGEAGWATDSFVCVTEARKKLQVAYAKSSVDLDNIENLFSTFEMASLIGRLSDLPKQTVEILPEHLRFMIMRTLERTILYPINGEDRVIPPPKYYDAFADLIIELSAIPEIAPVAIINFNYDLCLDYALTLAGRPPYYCLEPERLRRDSIDVMKVHGSLNWAKTDDFIGFAISPLQPLSMSRYWERLGLDKPAERPIDTMELMYGPDKMGSKLHPTPLIVPPTWNKGRYQEMLKPVWKAASQALSSAENIFVIGYSLPSADQFFRSFYSLSTISDSIIERFWLFDPSPNPAVPERFKSLLGPAILGRDKFRHTRAKFPAAIKEIATEFGLLFSNIDE